MRKDLCDAVRVVCCFLFAASILDAKPAKEELNRNCLACHEVQRVPSEMIYRRYLLRYSSKRVIRQKMVDYLLSPSVDRSIMPKPFFGKFPIKKASTLRKKRLEALVKAYIEHFDLAQKPVIVVEKRP